MSTKHQLRKDVEKNRRALDASWMENASERVVENIQKLDVFKISKTVALYRAIAGEVNLNPLFSLCWKLGKSTCIPVFNAALKGYEMAEITAETKFKTGHYGIQEPISPTLVSRNWIDLMVVPGVAFDPQGNRLGRGGGYYDCWLTGFTGETVAVAFDFQILPHIPMEPHDQPVGSIITETNVVKV